jgi:hypothetical protein
MPELDAFERSLEAAFRSFAERGVAPVDAVAFTERVAGRPRRRRWTVAFGPIPRLAWIFLLLAALLTVTVSAAIVGSGLLRRGPDLGVVLPPTVPLVASPAPWRPALVAGPTVTRSALGTITWRVYDVESAYGRLPVASTHGLVMLDIDDPGLLRWLAADGSWPGVYLPIEATAGRAIGDGMIAFEGTDAVRLSWDGARWVPGERLELPRALANVNAFVAGPRSTVAVGQVLDGSGGNAFSTDGVHFTMAARPPDWISDATVPHVLATEDGFVGLVPTRDVDNALGDPLAWTSADASEWTLATQTSPFGTLSAISSLASRDGRHVAVGWSDASVAGVWVSDDGLRWERAAITMPDLGQVAAGPAGWMIVGWHGGAWVSADGRAWEELKGWPGLTAHGGFDVAQAVAFGPGTVAVRGRLPATGEQDPGPEAIAIGTIEP